MGDIQNLISQIKYSSAAVTVEAKALDKVLNIQFDDL
jgi:hypothetical protein